MVFIQSDARIRMVEKICAIRRRSPHKTQWVAVNRFYGGINLALGPRRQF
jgi:hypothetical protein